MGDNARYWVTLTRGFSAPLPDADFSGAQAFFDLVSDCLDHKLQLEAVEVTLSSLGGFEISGVIEAKTGSAATQKMYDLANKAIHHALQQVPVPVLPDAPNQPQLKAHELLGRPTETRAVLLAVA